MRNEKRRKLVVIGCGVTKLRPGYDGSKECFAEYRGFNMTKSITLGEEMLSVDGIPVFCDDKAVAAAGVPKRVPGMVSGVDAHGNAVIVMNTAMSDENWWFIDASLRREVGHIILGHREKVPTINGVMCIFNGEHELAADQYAFGKVDVPRYLAHVNQYCDMTERIASLMKYVNDTDQHSV